MKIFKQLSVFLTLVLAVVACTEDEISYALQEVSAPSNVQAHFDIAQDDSGEVSVTPTADNVSAFMVYFGDEENETPTELSPGETAVNVYGEGEYSLKVVAVGPTGLTSELVRVVNITFAAPENLQADISISETNPFEVTVTPTADKVTVFDIYFGDMEDEEPTTILAGESATHLYAEAGEYTIRVVARGAGAATAELEEVVTISGGADPISLPITFDDLSVNYAFGTFNGASYEVVENPDASGANDVVSLVGAITNSGNNWEGGAFNLGTPVDFSGSNKTISMKFWSNVAVPVLMKFEGGVNGERENEVTVQHGGTGWELLEFNFATDAVKSFIDGSQGVGEPFVPEGQYGTIVLFIDGPGNTAGTFYMDDIAQTGGGSGGATGSAKVQDFEGAAPVFTVFGNIPAVEVVANPDPSGVNITGNVAQLTKSAGSETWAGSFFEVENPLDLNTYQNIKVDIWSPKSGAVVKLKLENADASIVHEVDLTTSVANEWETLVYDFSGAPAADYNRIVIFFDFGNPGDDSIYYYDEIELTNASGGTSSMTFEDFEGTPPAFTVFGNAAVEVIANPDPNGLNGTANVAQLTKPSGAETWAGAFFELGSPLDLATYPKIKVNTWSPKAGAVVKLKLENADASITHEVDLTTTNANVWEELVYDFSEAPAADYMRVVIFFDFGNAGDDSVYYYDQFALVQ